MPIASRGDTSVANMALALVGRQGIDAGPSKVIEAMYRNTALVARRMARLMRDRFDLGFVDVGWDAHVGQGAGLATGLTRARGAVFL